MNSDLCVDAQRIPLSTAYKKLAEPNSHLRLDTIAESYDHVKVVMGNISPHLTVSFLTNRPRFVTKLQEVYVQVTLNLYPQILSI